MGRRTKTFFEESARMNNTTYNQYYQRLMELSMTMFDWQNLPDTIDPRFLELILFRDGHIVFFKDEDLGYLALTAALNAPFDVYRIPQNRHVYASNGYTNNLTGKDSVIIYNNYTHTNSITDVRMFAKRLYNLDRIIDVNANAQKTPVLVQGSEQQRLTLLNMYKEFDGNAPVIFGDRSLDTDGLKAIRTDAPYVADKLYQLKTAIWNEALTYLGISNINVQKKERMISDEVMRNQGGIIASRYSRLESRRQAADKINKMFGLNIEVEYREDYREADDELMFAGESGGNDIKSMVVDTRTKTPRPPRGE